MVALALARIQSHWRVALTNSLPVPKQPQFVLTPMGGRLVDEHTTSRLIEMDSSLVSILALYLPVFAAVVGWMKIVVPPPVETLFCLVT